MTTGGTTAQPLDWQRAFRIAAISSAVLVLAMGAATSLLNMSAILGGDLSGIGADVNAYMDYTRQWLATGEWYAPVQLEGPYVVEDITGNVYPPTLLYLTVPFTVLPIPLWWAIPGAITIAALWRAGVSRRGWLVLAVLLACNPRWWVMLMLGNPVLWTIAFLCAGVVWAWPAVFAAVKVTFGPLALLGANHRSWWVAAAVALVLCIPFGHLWMDYLTVMQNTRSDRGLSYVLGEWPAVLTFVGVAWWARRPMTLPTVHERLVLAKQDAHRAVLRRECRSQNGAHRQPEDAADH